jgi:REP element-mobilizing transposase RayT
MSRPLRIEYPGAWYHVMNRGRRAESIFSDKYDYSAFIDLLIDITEMWRVNIAAYCLMPNHYHILLQTPEGNLSRCMRHINSVYTQRYNRKHGYDGQLFRGRYRSILVSDDAYLLQLVRYIHKNPLKAGLVDNIKDYQWSSYKGYLSYSQKWQWLHKDFIFSMITPRKQGRLKPFIEYMQDDDSADVTKLFSLKKRPSIFGSENFITRIKELYYFKKKDYEVPDSKSLAPTAVSIIEAVCEYYQVSFNDLLITKRGVFNKPRNTAVYLLRRMRGEDLSNIGELFNIQAYSTVSSIIRRIESLKNQDRKVKKEVEKIKETIYKGQT